MRNRTFTIVILSWLLPIFALTCQAAASATGTHSAGGTYAWNSTTGVLSLNWTNSDFVCEGPNLGADAVTGVTITASTMTWPNDGMTWTRSSGTAGDAVGTWTSTDSGTGNSFTAAVNADGTMLVTGVIVQCGGGGAGQNPSTNPEHWASGYYVHMMYRDSPKTATSVSVTGPGISGSKPLTYDASMGQWASWISPSTGVFLGTAYPTGLPYTYTFSIADTGTHTASSTVSCFQVPFVTNVSPTGSVAGTPTFSWTGIVDSGAGYGVEVNDSAGNRIWNNYNITATSVAYGGPPLTAGMTYTYLVLVDASSACSNGASFVQGSFTYGTAAADTTAPSVPTGLSAAAIGPNQVNVSWTSSTDNVGVSNYKVYRNGSLAASPAGANNTSWPDNSVVPGTSYSYTVVACDAAGNCSTQSVPAAATTPADSGLGQFDGIYSGSWSINCCDQPAGGTFTIAVANGVLSNMQVNITSGVAGILFTSGTVSSTGSIAAGGIAPVQCGGSATTFTGQITLGLSGDAVMNMSFSRPASNTCGVNTGSMSATRTTGGTTTSSTTSSTTTTTSFTTTSSTTTTTQAGGGTATTLVSGWNLLGNGMGNAITVAGVFGDSSLVTTVWKWISGANPAWAFYTPTLGDGGAAYAASKGYTFLTTINAGEGFWVNAKGAFPVQLSGSAVPTNSFADGLTSNALSAGWSLIAIGDNKTPLAFVNSIAVNPPAAGTSAATSLTTLWAWDAAFTGWYFFAPSLVNAGTQASYIASKAYLDFGSKSLTPTTGFWVNHP